MDVEVAVAVAVTAEAVSECDDDRDDVVVEVLATLVLSGLVAVAAMVGDMCGMARCSGTRLMRPMNCCDTQRTKSETEEKMNHEADKKY